MQMNKEKLEWARSTNVQKCSSNTAYNECPVCDYYSCVRSNVKRHMYTRHALGYKCQNCGKYFSLPEDLRTHTESCSPKTPTLKKVACIPTSLKARRNSCPSKTTKNKVKENLETRRKSFYPKSTTMKHVSKSFRCAKCEFTTLYIRNLYRHMSRIHKSSGRDIYKCEDCDKAFDSLGNLKNHQKNCIESSSIENVPLQYYKSALAEKINRRTLVKANSQLTPIANQNRTTLLLYPDSDELSDLDPFVGFPVEEVGSDTRTPKKVKSLTKTADSSLPKDTCLFACGKCSEIFQNKSEYGKHEKYCPCAVRMKRDIRKPKRYLETEADESAAETTEQHARTPKKVNVEHKKSNSTAIGRKARKAGVDHSGKKKINIKNPIRRRLTDTNKNIEKADEAKDIPIKTAEAGAYHCVLCEKKFDDANLLQNHADEFHSVSAMSPEERRLALIKALAALYPPSVEEDMEKYRCKLCDIVCLDAAALEGHMKRHL